ncbi:MAG: amidohydrolase family protein [Alphaproteobacteria bacterium]|nr:amidohydrolase family protein [Alphaproteobacteria bacterium]
MLLQNATLYDGTGAPPRRADLLVQGDRIAALGPGLQAPEDVEVIDASALWLTPGFVDLHTHYDAEVEVLPGLTESLRHGVTTLALGSCGLSLAVGRPVDMADMFCRVEGIPRRVVLPLLERVVDWSGPAEYLEHLRGLPLGPNLFCMLGHSTIRAAAMGIDRALDASVRPSAEELARMQAWLEEALDAGFVGLSVNTLPWDKMDGEAHRSKPTPSVFARWSEYRALAATLRTRGRVLQGVPNLRTKLNVLLFMALSTGLGRQSLKTTLITLMDPKADRLVAPLVGRLTRALNRWLGADLRFQALPCPFDLYTDGLDVPFLEEIGAGTEALHLTDPEARAALLLDPAFRRRFRRQWTSRIYGRAYHRDLSEARVVGCPDARWVGKSFAEVGAARGSDPIDAFLDLQAEHGEALRWYTVAANDRPEVLEWILTRPDILVGFSDAGAHLRNMAFYNFPLRLLYRVREAELAGRPFMSVEEAVRRLTSEIADWMGVRAGRLAEGERADLVLIDPSALDARAEELQEAPVQALGRLRRLVRRNDDAVRLVMVNGQVAWRDGAFSEGVGRRRMGRVLEATNERHRNIC